MNRYISKTRDLVHLNSLWERHKLPVFQKDRVIDGWRLCLRPSTDLTRATTFEKKEALDIANNEDVLPTFLEHESKPRGLFTGTYVNLKHHGSFNKDLNPENPYAHVLLQVHETHRTGMDTLLAIVFMPRGRLLPVSVVREAFLGSLQHEAEAWIVS